jgi:hypothetical protein
MLLVSSEVQCNEPPVGSDEERRRFAELQAQLGPMFRKIFPDPQAPRTVVVIPSHSLDQEVLSKISGVHHYEERMLCLLMLLKFPRTNVVYVSSQPIHDTIIDYYLHLLPGIPGKHARQRLTMLSCHDSSPVALSQKILERPRLLARIRQSIPDRHSAHITCFNASPLERTLAVRLNIPLYACDPALRHLGSKSNSRAIFKEAGVDTADGFEHLRDEQDLVQALSVLKQRNPQMRRAVIKLNDGFSGEGNAVFSYNHHGSDGRLERWIEAELPHRTRFEAAEETWDQYQSKFADMGGIVECWVDGKHKCSPSVQCRINPLGEAELVSTHDQVLGGPNGQVFLGCTFPADRTYRQDIQEAGMRVANVLKQRGVIGRFGIDFVSVRSGNQWKHYAIEINLRKGGTTLPFLMLQFLTNGEYDVQSGRYYIPTGRSRYYYASDNLQKPIYKGLTPDDLIDTMVYNGLHFHSASQYGVVFHLMGALSEFGKFGVVCIGKSREHAQMLYNHTLSALDGEIN